MQRRHRLEDLRESRHRQGTLTFEGRPESSGQRGLQFQENASSKHCVFSFDFEIMPFKERDIRKMIAEVDRAYRNA